MAQSLFSRIKGSAPQTGQISKKPLSNNGRYVMILRLTKNTSADFDGGACEQVPEKAQEADGSKTKWR